MLNWLRIHRKWLIPTVVATALISLLFSITLHLQHRKQEERKDSAIEKNNEKGVIQTDGRSIPQDKPKQIRGLPATMIPEDKISDFSQEPSPSDLIHRLEEMTARERKIEENKFAELRLIWPLYFFSIMKHRQDTATVMLDASEDGFGVIIVTEINLQRYPGITTTQLGDRVWVAGKIAEVDTHGTGQINLISEYVGFTDGKSQSGARSQKSADKPDKQKTGDL